MRLHCQLVTVLGINMYLNPSPSSLLPSLLSFLPPPLPPHLPHPPLPPPLPPHPPHPPSLPPSSPSSSPPSRNSTVHQLSEYQHVRGGLRGRESLPSQQWTHFLLLVLYFKVHVHAVGVHVVGRTPASIAVVGSNPTQGSPLKLTGYYGCIYVYSFIALSFIYMYNHVYTCTCTFYHYLQPYTYILSHLTVYGFVYNLQDLVKLFLHYFMASFIYMYLSLVSLCSIKANDETPFSLLCLSQNFLTTEKTITRVPCFRILANFSSQVEQ